MAYIDETYIDNLCDTNVVDAFFTDIGAGAVNSTALTQAIATAASLVKSALRNAGYTPPGDSDTIPEIVKTATFGAFVKIMYGRKQLEVPEQYADVVSLLERIRKGDEDIDGLSLDEAAAVGGVSFSDHSDTSTSGRPPIFDRSGMSEL